MVGEGVGGGRGGGLGFCRLSRRGGWGGSNGPISLQVGVIPRRAHLVVVSPKRTILEQH